MQTGNDFTKTQCAAQNKLKSSKLKWYFTSLHITDLDDVNVSHNNGAVLTYFGSCYAVILSLLSV